MLQKRQQEADNGCADLKNPKPGEKRKDYEAESGSSWKRFERVAEKRLHQGKEGATEPIFIIRRRPRLAGTWNS